MLEVILTFSTEEGFEKIQIDKEKTSFGRGGDADFRFADNGLSRLHASIFREGDRLWVVDENSSNGTFVNGEKVTASGTPIQDGDTIKIGHVTNLSVSFSERHDDAPAIENDSSAYTSIPNGVTAESTEAEKSSMLIPLMITGFALLVICAAGVFIGVSVIKGNRTQLAVTDDREDNYDYSDDYTDNSNKPEISNEENSGSNLIETTGDSTPANSDPGNLTDSPTANPSDDPPQLPSGKTYGALSSSEKDQYIKVKAEKVARIIGNRSGESIPPAAIAQIRRWLDGYAGRIRGTRLDDCGGRTYLKSDMVSLLERARKNAPFIIRSFNEKGIDPQVGLYLAMIESEHCPCLQSGTGPLGMFQFTQATGRAHGLDTRSGASPANPDERCQPQAASEAAASYMKTLTGRIGTGPLSIPLAIASYNSGEGGLGKNLKTALEANESQDRSFWTLVANAEKLASQFQTENIKYVPKFFGAAIIGENPRDFGVAMQPLSTYSR